MFSPSRTIVSSSPSVAMILVHTFNLSSKIETIPNPHPKEINDKNKMKNKNKINDENKMSDKNKMKNKNKM